MKSVCIITHNEAKCIFLHINSICFYSLHVVIKIFIFVLRITKWKLSVQALSGWHLLFPYVRATTRLLCQLILWLFLHLFIWSSKDYFLCSYYCKEVTDCHWAELKMKGSIKFIPPVRKNAHFLRTLNSIWGTEMNKDAFNILKKTPCFQ